MPREIITGYDIKDNTITGAKFENNSITDAKINSVAFSKVTGTISATQHGILSDSTLHAIATTGAAGFFAALDKTKLDGITAGAQKIYAVMATHAFSHVGNVDKIGSIDLINRTTAGDPFNNIYFYRNDGFPAGCNVFAFSCVHDWATNAGGTQGMSFVACVGTSTPPAIQMAVGTSNSTWYCRGNYASVDNVISGTSLYVIIGAY